MFNTRVFATISQDATPILLLFECIERNLFKQLFSLHFSYDSGVDSLSIWNKLVEYAANVTRLIPHYINIVGFDVNIVAIIAAS